MRRADRTLAALAPLLFSLAAPSGAVILTNPNFDTDVEHWTEALVGGTGSAQWSPLDANGDPDSGSLRLETSDTFDGRQSECFEIDPFADYERRAQILVPTQAYPPVPKVRLVYYANLDCTNAVGALDSSFPEPPLDTWVAVAELAPSVWTAHAARVWLLLDDSPAGSHVAFFDDVRMELAPEPDAAMGALGAFAPLAALMRRRR